MDLREYQLDAIEALRSQVRAGKKRVLLQAPTGSGKTVVAAEIIRSAVSKGSTVLFVAHRRELIFQSCDKLQRFGIGHGVLLSGHEEIRPGEQVQVASLATLWARCVKRERIELPPADLIVFDEAHRSCAPTYQELLSRYPDAVVLGLTATPARKGGQGLGAYYQALVKAVGAKRLIAEGYLVPTRILAPYRPDLRGLRVTGGDFAKDDLNERMDKQELVGSIVDTWVAHAENRQTLVFASGVQHSVHLRDRFRAAGVRAEHVDGKSTNEERRMLIASLLSGDIQVITNCDVFTEGTDMPIVSCAVLARPTKSLVRYLQMAGRISRPSPESGKVDALLLDHSGNVYRHGFPDDEIAWELEKGKKAKNVDLSAGRSVPITCPQCHLVYRAANVCPNCGYRRKVSPKAVQTREGHLVEVRRGAEYDVSHEEQVRYWKRCLGIAAGRRASFKMALAMFRQQFSRWPPNDVPFKAPQNTSALVTDVYPGFGRSRS